MSCGSVQATLLGRQHVEVRVDRDLQERCVPSPCCEVCSLVNVSLTEPIKPLTKTNQTFVLLSCDVLAVHHVRVTLVVCVHLAPLHIIVFMTELFSASPAA